MSAAVRHSKPYGYNNSDGRYPYTSPRPQHDLPHKPDLVGNLPPRRAPLQPSKAESRIHASERPRGKYLASKDKALPAVDLSRFLSLVDSGLTEQNHRGWLWDVISKLSDEGFRKATTHHSAVDGDLANSYEYLEHEGDACFHIAATQLIAKVLPESTLYERTTLRIDLTKSAPLAAIGRNLSLERHVKTRNNLNDHLIEDVTEAICGCIMDELGLEMASKWAQVAMCEPLVELALRLDQTMEKLMEQRRKGSTVAKRGKIQIFNPLQPTSPVTDRSKDPTLPVVTTALKRAGFHVSWTSWPDAPGVESSSFSEADEDEDEQTLKESPRHPVGQRLVIQKSSENVCKVVAQAVGASRGDARQKASREALRQMHEFEDKWAYQWAMEHPGFPYTRCSRAPKMG